MYTTSNKYTNIAYNTNCLFSNSPCVIKVLKIVFCVLFYNLYQEPTALSIIENV